MNFVRPLVKSINPTTSENYDIIYVVLNRLIKYVYFIVTRSTINATKLTYVFIRNIFTAYKMPSKLIFDRDPLF